MATYHVTSIRNGSIYGHAERHCDPTGCAGHDRYLGSTAQYPHAHLDGSLAIPVTCECGRHHTKGHAPGCSHAEPRCYACDEAPVGFAERHTGDYAYAVPACQRHADPTIKTPVK